MEVPPPLGEAASKAEGIRGPPQNFEIMKKFQVKVFCSILTLSICGATLTRPKEFRKLGGTGSEFVPNQSKGMPTGREPTCDELRAMWRFSRRQSRAAEITNEIPTYRDPFVYNVWEHVPKARSALGRPPPRPYSKPVYGRIVKSPPSDHPRLLEESRAYDEMLRHSDSESQEDEVRRRLQLPSYRLSGGQWQGYGQPSPKGSFQRLKELIWAERAKELQQQRLLDAMATKERIIQQYRNHRKDKQKGQTSNYKSPNQDPKSTKMRMINAETDFDNGYGFDSFSKPFRQRSAFNPEDFEEELW